MAAIQYLINAVAETLSILLLIYIVLSVLISFQIINPRQRFVSMVHDGLRRLFEPVLSKIRRILPDTGQLDLSPILLFILIRFVQYLLLSILF